MKVSSSSPKSVGAKYSQSRTDSLIGAGVRVEGNMRFEGVLRIEGDLLGDVSCDADANGTIVVGESGSVSGTIKTPHVVVGGRVHGPVHSWESIEIQQGAHVAGDTFYREIDIHPGGVIEGLLTPGEGVGEDRDRLQIPGSPARQERDSPLTDPASDDGGVIARLGGTRRIGAALALVIVAAVAAGVLMTRDPASVVSPAASPSSDVVLKAEPPVKDPPAAQTVPAAGNRGQDDAKAVAGNAVPSAPPAADVGSVAPVPPAAIAETDPGKVALVQGVNPGKPVGVLLVIGKEPAVLFRKKRQDSAEGTRIDISRGATESIPFAKNEVFRVASGRDLQIFYQGRKVAPKIIESGVWMSFVPHSSGGAGNKN